MTGSYGTVGVAGACVVSAGSGVSTAGGADVAETAGSAVSAGSEEPHAIAERTTTATTTSKRSVERGFALRILSKVADSFSRYKRANRRINLMRREVYDRSSPMQMRAAEVAMWAMAVTIPMAVTTTSEDKGIGCGQVVRGIGVEGF